MSQTIQEKNKALVLDAFDTLFNKRDYAVAERHEAGTIVADENFVIVHGRFSGTGSR